MPAASEQQASQDREPLRRTSTSESNRNRVQENQRILAANLLTYTAPVVGCVIILLLMLLVAGFVIYVQGWIVLSNTYNIPCDQPLQWWLLAMLFVPILHIQLNSGGQEDQRPKKLLSLAMPLGIAVGAWLFMRCHTCAKTNPELFFYAKKYLIYQFIVWLMMVFMSCGLVSFVFWLHRNGLLDSGPGPHAAGRTGLINDIETVQFSPELFSTSPDDELEPPECPICFEEFHVSANIKRTPCGHHFHEECLGQWLERYGKVCPLCRKDLEEAVEVNNEPSGP